MQLEANDLDPSETWTSLRGGEGMRTGRLPSAGAGWPILHFGVSSNRTGKSKSFRDTHGSNVIIASAKANGATQSDCAGSIKTSPPQRGRFAMATAPGQDM
ncbi:hypothetical protein Tasa_002_012 [Tanticharoenia sakaeratensis NBRC 103193]|uniref:Uncharacterized protein n=1 Tax=Tanticharoenia sakaeratensis NBRC 103193 TaxID=1231623 RepID=A0A0D6MGG8_9PROT|nr:hypothetical protein Tasa_002_012 [Tanticharoenia sakaeratensis NBRC 103193]